MLRAKVLKLSKFVLWVHFGDISSGIKMKVFIVTSNCKIQTGASILLPVAERDLTVIEKCRGLFYSTTFTYTYDIATPNVGLFV